MISFSKNTSEPNYSPKWEDRFLFRCIYDRRQCGTQPSKEHVIPRLLGHFWFERSELEIEDSICGKCNNEELSRLDEELSGCSFVGLMRSKVGITDKHQRLIRKKSAPLFYRYENPLVAWAEIPDRDGVEFLALDNDNIQFVPLDCLIYWHSTKQRSWPFPYKSKMNRERIFAILNSHGVTELHVSISDLLWPEIEKKFSNDFKLTRIPRFTNPISNAHVEVQTEATPQLMRAIVKIAFHYMICFGGRLGVSGYESCFQAVKQFIIEGTGSPDQFFKYSTQHILPVGSEYGRAIPHRGHLVGCAIHENQVLAYLQFFTGRDCDAGTYCVNLGEILWAARKPVKILRFFNLETGQVEPVKKGWLNAQFGQEYE